MIEIQPMLATTTDKLPTAENDYGFEIKWDGIRAIVYVNPNKLQIKSRNNKDITSQYPELTDLAKSVSTPCILDGEIVALDNQGRPSFSALQHRMGRKNQSTIQKLISDIPVTYIIFDILYLEKPLINETFITRRQILQSLHLNGSFWQTPEYKTGNGQLLQAASRKLGLEGIVAKKLTSSYLPGQRTSDWLKIKNINRQELVIGGWTAGKGSRENDIGALLVGYYALPQTNVTPASQKLIYAGSVGTGFTASILKVLRDALDKIKQDTNPFSEPVPKKNAIFVTPVLVGEFEFTEWTPSGTLRHPSFKGLRSDKAPSQVIRET